jgi:hypothetical protein
VAEQVERPVDGSGAENAEAWPASDDARLLQVREEVLYVRGLDVRDRPIASPIEERLHGPGVVLGERQPLGHDVPGAIHVRELAERHRLSRRWSETARIELAGTNRDPQLVEGSVGLGLRMDRS